MTSNVNYFKLMSVETYNNLREKSTNYFEFLICNEIRLLKRLQAHFYCSIVKSNRYIKWNDLCFFALFNFLSVVLLTESTRNVNNKLLIRNSLLSMEFKAQIITTQVYVNLSILSNNPFLCSEYIAKIEINILSIDKVIST